MRLKPIRSAFERYWHVAFLAYLLVSVLLVELWFETEVDAAFWWGLEWLLGPWVALLYAGWFWLDADFRPRARRCVAHGVLLGWAIVLAVGSGGYVALANHLIGPHETHREEGVVERLGRIRGRFGPTEYTLVLRRDDGTTVKLSVERALHERLRVGDPFRQERVRGGLGLTYRLR